LQGDLGITAAVFSRGVAAFMSVFAFSFIALHNCCPSFLPSAQGVRGRIKKQGWVRRERRKRDNPNPVECYYYYISSRPENQYNFAKNFLLDLGLIFWAGYGTVDKP
jgi:hypothetical protein